jgi:DUF1680 family protein
VEARAAGWTNRLYASADGGETGDLEGTRRPAQLTAVPYYAWANRAPGAMQVWIKGEPPGA